MAETYVTVATYIDPMEAEMARSRLEAEGITAQMIGNETADLFSGMVGLVGSIQVRVPEQKREAAVALLAQVEQARLDRGWENRTEFDAGVWVCPLCGEAVEESLSVCPSCQTERPVAPRHGIQDREGLSSPSAPAGSSAAAGSQEIQQPGRMGKKKKKEKRHRSTSVEGDVDLPPVDTFLGDDLARRACLAGLFTLMCAGLARLAAVIAVFGFIPLGLYSLWLLARLAIFPGPLSSRGMLLFYSAIAFDLIALLIAVAFVAPLWIIFG
jgi:hypothetical protein